VPAGVAAIVLCAQAEDRLKYEVASIRPANPKELFVRIEAGAGGSFHATSITLQQLVMSAYNVRDFQVSGGPGWVGTERYNVLAKPEEAEPPLPSTSSRATFESRAERERERLRNLLKDRFQLVIRWETRQLPVYALTIAKGGLKMKPAPAGPTVLQGSHGRLMGKAVTIDRVKRVLTDVLGRPVVDEAGLTGSFDFKLEWTPEASPSADPSQVLPPAGESIFAAIQEQLGLKVESKKGPVETIVIEKAEKPSEN
jgi:uncharacterized protein (TIGR03435 family)